MKKIAIETSSPYEVVIEEGLIERVGEELLRIFSPCQAAIITDTTVNALYGEVVEESLKKSGFQTLRFAFEAGESHKRLCTLEEILEFLAENQMTRSDVIIALGGGVVGDMAGFAAAVYARGIRFVQIPTTLLAAVDSSVGGKTAVDLKAGKNLAGAFHQPSLVLTDSALISRLPAALLSDGAAEVIKYGVLADPELFGWMTQKDWTCHLDEIIARSVCIKRDFVVKDEYDTGLRQLLNLGHTFGHAIEKCSDFSISHGQGVALGMAIAAGAAGKEEICKDILLACQTCSLPKKAPYSPRELSQAALSDKKRKGDTLSLVLPETIGCCRLEKIHVSQLEDAFRRGMEMVEALCQ